MDLDRFRKVLGMLGSDQPGERSAAALKATEMLKESGVDWAAVSINQPETAQKPAGGDLNVLMRTLEEREALKSALATEKIRVRILEADIVALRNQIYGLSQPKAEDIPPPVPERKRKRTGSFWGL